MAYVIFIPPCSVGLEDHDELFITTGGSRAGETKKWGELVRVTEPVDVVVPVECCSCFFVDAPIRGAARLSRAVPFIVEDLLVEDVEQFHVAVGEISREGRLQVIAVKRDQIRNWVDRLRAKGFYIRRMVVDADSLPNDRAYVFVQGDRAIVGGRQEARYGCLVEALPQLLDGAEDAVILGDRNPEEYAPWKFERVSEKYGALSEGVSRALNLAQGEFGNKGARLRVFGGVAASFLFAFLCYLVLVFSKAMYLERETRILAERNLNEYRNLFPQDERIVDLRVQFDAHLRQAGRLAGGGFISGLYRVARMVGEYPSVSVREVSFAGDVGEFSLTLSAADFSQLNALQESFKKEGLAVRSNDMVREAGVVASRFTISMR